MGVGTSIFLASFLISSILLYAHTKERWKWSKIFKISFIGFFGLIFLCGTLFYCITYYENLPKTITEFEGIKLGDSKKDVVFKLGNPKEEYKNTLKYNNIKIFLKDEKVNEIRLVCYQGYYNGLNRIYCGDQSEALERKYKSWLNQLYSEKDALFRIFQAPKYNTAYFLYQNKVIAMAIRATPFDEIMVDREAKIRQLEVSIARDKEILRLREKIEHEENVQKERKSASNIKPPLTKEKAYKIALERGLINSKGEIIKKPTITKEAATAELARRGIYLEPPVTHSISETKMDLKQAARAELEKRGVKIDEESGLTSQKPKIVPQKKSK